MQWPTYNSEDGQQFGFEVDANTVDDVVDESAKDTTDRDVSRKTPESSADVPQKGTGNHDHRRLSIYEAQLLNTSGGSRRTSVSSEGSDSLGDGDQLDRTKEGVDAVMFSRASQKPWKGSRYR